VPSGASASASQNQSAWRINTPSGLDKQKNLLKFYNSTIIESLK
jgi:hypothetical protein